MSKFKDIKSNNNELSLEDFMNLLSENERVFFNLIYSKLSDDKKSVNEIVTEIVTKDNISFERNGNKILIVLPNQQRIELPQDISKKLIDNGLGQKVYVNAILHSSKRKIIDEGDLKIIEDATKNRVDKSGLIVIINKINREIEHIDYKIKIKNDLKKTNNIEIDRLNKEIEELEKQKEELEKLIKQLNIIIIKYEEEIKKLKEKENKEKIKQEKVVEEKEEKKKNNLGLLKWFGIIGIAAATIVAIGVILDKLGISKDKEVTSIDDFKPSIEGSDNYSDNNLIDSSKQDYINSVKEKIYNHFYNTIVNSMHPGQITRQAQDAYDGWNYDQSIMGKGKTSYDYNLETNIRPGADFINRYNAFITKYENADPNLLIDMINDGSMLLDEYQSFIGVTINLVHKHNESTQEAMDMGVADKDSYQTQKVLTEQQKIDLLNESQNIDKIKSQLGIENVDLLLEGIEDGKFDIQIDKNGLVTFVDLESNNVIITNMESLLGSDMFIKSNAIERGQ